jgi:N-methylhydantoinase A
LTTVGRIEKPPLRAFERATGEAPPKEHRQVFFAEADGFVECPIHDRYALGAGASIPGPAVLEELDSTVVVHPGYGARVDEHGNLVIRKEHA